MSSPGLTGRSHIPETAQLKSRSRGVLGPPVKPGDDSGGVDKPSRSRGISCPSFASSFAPRNNEGAGNTGCWPHPRALRAKEMHFVHASNTGQPKQPAFPAQWFYGLYVVSSVSGLV